MQISRPILTLLFCAAIWGGSGMLYKAGSEFASSIEMAFMRMFIGGTLLLSICIFQRKEIFSIDNIKKSAILGIFSYAVPFILIAKASTIIDTGIVAILGGVLPVFTVILSFLFLKHKISSKEMYGILFSVIGIALIYCNIFYGSVKINIMGIAMVITANILYAAITIFIRAKCSNIPPMTLSGLSICFGALTLMPFFLMNFNFGVILEPGFIIPMLILGIFGTSIAYLLYFMLINQYGANFASTHSFLVPIFGCLYGSVFFAEKLTSAKIGGIIAIIIGMGLINNFSIKSITSRMGKYILNYLFNQNSFFS